MYPHHRGPHYWASAGIYAVMKKVESILLTEPGVLFGAHGGKASQIREVLRWNFHSLDTFVINIDSDPQSDGKNDDNSAGKSKPRDVGLKRGNSKN